MCPDTNSRVSRRVRCRETETGARRDGKHALAARTPRITIVSGAIIASFSSFRFLTCIENGASLHSLTLAEMTEVAINMEAMRFAGW